MPQKAGSLKKINQIDNPLASLLRKKEKGFKLKKSEMKEVTKDIIETQRIMIKYHEKLYASKFNT